MIAAGFLPTCPAAWHRAVLELVRAGWWLGLPGADRWPPVMWLAAPAALATVLAIAMVATSHVRAFLIVLGLAGAVHPWLPAALVPLAFAIRTWPRPDTLSTPAVVGALLWVIGVWMSPGCASPLVGSMQTAGLLGAWWATLGLAGAALLALDLLFSLRSRRSQVAALAVLLMSAALLAGVPDVDRPALLGAAAAVLWWRMAGGAMHVLVWPTTTLGRAGALMLVGLVPVVAVARADAARMQTADPGTVETWRALETVGGPAAVMTTGGRADTATTIWRSGPSEAQQALLMIPPDPDALSQYLATREVYAWSGAARALAMRGLLVAPVPMPGQPQSPLWRVLQVERCLTLTPAWMDVGATATFGQLAGVFPVVEPNRGALVYIASSRALTPRPLDWPPESAQGLDARIFDRQSAADRAALADALARDELSAATLGTSRFVTRLRFDRRGTAPETLAVMLGGVATAAWGRLYAAGDPRPDRQPSLCRSGVGQPITGYPGAPAVLALDLSSEHTTGGGWHAPEQAGDDRFRWTAEPEADVLFVAHRAQPLQLRLDAQPGTGDWSTAALRITLNDAEVRCVSGEPPCEWMLSAEAMRTGLNVITLHSATVPAPAPDPRRLGLLVRGVTLARP